MAKDLLDASIRAAEVMSSLFTPFVRSFLLNCESNREFLFFFSCLKPDIVSFETNISLISYPFPVQEETTAAKAAAAAAKQELEECVASAAATSATLKAACEARVEEAQAAVAEAQTREKEAREDLDRLRYECSTFFPFSFSFVHTSSFFSLAIKLPCNRSLLLLVLVSKFFRIVTVCNFWNDANNFCPNRSCVDDQSKLIASMQAQQKALDEKAASGDSASEALVERCAALQHALNENQAKAAAKEEALAEAAHRAAVEHEAYARNCRAEAEAARTSAANTAAELAALTRERDSLAAAAVRKC